MKVAIVNTGIGWNASNPCPFYILIKNYLEYSRHKDNIRIFAQKDGNPLHPDTLPFTPIDRENFAEPIRNFNPDIIEVHDYALAIALASLFPEIPVLHVSHNTPPPPSLKFKPLKRLPMSKMMARLAGIIHVSRFCCKKTMIAFPELRHRFFLLQNSMPAEPWKANYEEKEKTIVFVGRAVPDKGIGPLMEAMHRLLPFYPEWKFVLLTTTSILTPEAQEFFLQKYEKIKPLGAQVTLIENASKKEVQHYYKKASIALCPSDYDDPSPLSQLEATLASCAVVSSGRGGMKEINGEDGALYLDEVSPQEIEKAVRFLIDNPKERKALALRGYDYANKNIRVEKQAAKLDDIREKLVAEHKPASKAKLFYYPAIGFIRATLNLLMIVPLLKHLAKKRKEAPQRRQARLNRA